jgi:ribonuclease Z
MSRILILGSANAVPKPGQDNTHLLIESAEKVIMVDCGNNPVAKLVEAGTSILAVTDLVLTHFHADHVASLPLLIMDMWLEKRATPLTIHGLQVTLEKARQLLELFSWKDWPGMYPVHFNVIPDDGMQGFITDSNCRIDALPVQHLVPTIGMRVELTCERVVTYSCDTEPCDNLRILAANADVLLMESAGPGKGHTSAEQAGMIAHEAGVKKLVLIHYENRADQTAMLNGAAKHFNGIIMPAKDMMSV